MTRHTTFTDAIGTGVDCRVAHRVFLLCLFSLVVLAPAWAANADQPIPMAVYDTFHFTGDTAPGFDASFVGVFTSIIGGDVVNGTSRMDVKFITGDIVHCRFTWVSAVGTIVLSSVCVLSNGHGAWRIESGTGRYEDLTGVGTETFGKLPPGGLYTDYERFAGVATHTKRDGKE